MKTKLLIMVTGFPGSGKTAFAAALADKLQTGFLNTARIRENMGSKEKDDPSSRESVYQQLIAHTEALLQTGATVIVDGTFYNQRVRRPYQLLAQRYHYATTWIEIKAPEDLIRQRLTKKNMKDQEDFQAYLKVKAAWEPLERTHLLLWSDELSVEDMVRRAEEYLSLLQS